MKTKGILSLFMLIIILSTACKKEKFQIDKDKDAIKEYLKVNNIEAIEKNNIFYTINKASEGEQCEVGDTVAVKYNLYALHKPDSLLEECQDKAFIFTVGYGRVIRGWEYALPIMKEGEISRFYIPSALAYGNQEIAGKSYANLIFDIELCEIKHRDKRH
ncbi:MAG: FKBP-type peptidyl-prolyl cis-trans isomerase [Bacteroidales bacterium]|nr:FKBP-type peptidyl-prolyl cis-trans isomerase [Bacteroidales bacterium]